MRKVVRETKVLRDAWARTREAKAYKISKNVVKFTPKVVKEVAKGKPPPRIVMWLGGPVRVVRVALRLKIHRYLKYVGRTVKELRFFARFARDVLASTAMLRLAGEATKSRATRARRQAAQMIQDKFRAKVARRVALRLRARNAKAACARAEAHNEHADEGHAAKELAAEVGDARRRRRRAGDARAIFAYEAPRVDITDRNKTPVDHT